MTQPQQGTMPHLATLPITKPKPLLENLDVLLGFLIYLDNFMTSSVSESGQEAFLIF